MNINVSEVQRIHCSDFQQVYANSASIGATFYDACITFGQIIAGPEKDEVHVEERVAVSMSWEHLKALSVAMQKAVQAYESDGKGQIRNKPETQDAEVKA